MNPVFFTSDHHFGPKNTIIPKDYINTRNKMMIEQWNSVVTNDDVVFHLGDFSELDYMNTTNIINQLKGYKILIMGNHDKNRDRTTWLAHGLNEVIDYPILYEQKFLLSHEHLNDIYAPFFNIHGHFHNPDQKYISDRHINVGVDYWDHKPVSLNIIKEDFNMRIK